MNRWGLITIDSLQKLLPRLEVVQTYRPNVRWQVLEFAIDVGAQGSSQSPMQRQGCLLFEFLITGVSPVDATRNVAQQRTGSRDHGRPSTTYTEQAGSHLGFRINHPPRQLPGFAILGGKGRDQKAARPHPHRPCWHPGP